MAAEKISFERFLESVEPECRPFVAELHSAFMEYGCKIEIKEAKSGYVVSYLFNKKTVANYVFRKKGLFVRIYANHHGEYPAFLDTMPEALAKAVAGAPDCKRLLDPCSCNPKCATGYDFLIGGERFQKCRNNAFLFLVCEESKPFLRDFLLQELEACKKDA